MAEVVIVTKPYGVCNYPLSAVFPKMGICGWVGLLHGHSVHRVDYEEHVRRDHRGMSTPPSDIKPKHGITTVVLPRIRHCDDAEDLRGQRLIRAKAVDINIIEVPAFQHATLPEIEALILRGPRRPRA